MDLQTIAGYVLAAGGALWAAVSFIRGKAAQAGDVVDEVMDRIKHLTKDTTPPDRREALEQAETLLQFLEAKGSTAGVDAMMVVVKEILTKKV